MDRSLQSLLRDFDALSPARKRFLIITGSLLVLLVLVLVSRQKDAPDTKSSLTTAGHAVPLAEAFPPNPVDAMRADPMHTGPVIDNDRAAFAPKSLAYGSRPDDLPGSFAEPRISYSAELAVATKEFVRTRSSMEEILDRHRGYTAKLRMVGQPSGSVLSATLRVPASEYASALAELKSVGDLERDEEAADEILEQHGNLEARLQNAQNAEHRLLKLLEDHPGAAVSVSQLQQQQLAQLRGEIARIQAERQVYDNRAVFSNIYFSLREQRMAPVETFAAQLRSSSIHGLSDVLHILSAIVLFCVNYGPSLLVWAALLFFPARLLWRRSRATLARSAA
jgi:hypothetical protein